MPELELLTTPDYQQIKHNFIGELTVASQGYPSSLSYIKHVLPDKPIITTGVIQAIVIGGTNYDIVSVTVDEEGNMQGAKRQRGINPNFDSKETFLNFIKERFDPAADAIAVNMGFPMKPTIGKYGEIDSEVLYGTKEHALHDMHGQSVGDMLRDHLHVDIPVSVANDTVCLALSDTGEEDGGFIVGSGCNMALMVDEKGKRIVINLESGNFSKFDPTPGLEAIDAVSPTRGKNRFEKLISGIYLPMHFNFMSHQDNINCAHVANGKELSRLAEDDGTIAGDLARGILERSASLAATQLAAIYDWKGNHPEMIFTVEGSLFWDAWDYETNVKRRLKLLGVPAGKIKFKKVQDSSIKGAVGLLTL